MSRSPFPPPGETKDLETRDIPSASPDRETLDRSLVSGVAWTGGVKWGVQVLTWATTIVVMRLLTPEDYGLVGMAGLFLGLVSLVSEFGLGSAIVALRKLSKRQIAQLNSVAVCIGVAALGLSAAAAGPVGAFFESPRLPPVILVMSTTFVISALNVVPKAILKRDLRYRTLALVEGGQAVGAAIVTLLLAWLGFGYWALVVGRIADFLVATIVLLIIAPRGFALPRFGEIREAIAFSSHVIAARIAWYTYSNADYLIIGKLLGQQALGLYTSAFTLSRMPAEKIAGMVTRVTPGIFSAVQDDLPALRRYVLIVTEGIAIVTFPPIIGLGLVAPELIPVLLGDQWIGATVPLQILSVGAALRAVTPLLPQILNVIQETRYGMGVSVVAAVAFMAGFYVGSFWGIAGVALAWVILDPFFVALPVLLKVRQRIGLTLRSYLSTLWPAVSGCLAMAGVVVGLRSYASDNLSAPLLLTAEVLGGAATYTAVILLAHRSRLSRMFRATRLLRGSP